MAAEKAILGEDQTVDLLSVVGMLRRRKWLIMLVTALGTATAAFVGMKLTPTYTAQASVMIDPRQLQVTTSEEVLSGLPLSGPTMATQLGLLRSRDFVAAVMGDLKLFDDPEFNPALVPADEAATSLPTFLQPLEQLITRLPDEWLIATGLASQPQPVLESEAPAIARERAITNFLGDAVFLNDGVSYLIQIQFTSPDSDKAAVIANRLASRFVEDQLQGKLSATDKA
ncbi:MAG: Wzz/FepE/Etk N-terminal domain-containing protein, partial [Geminicoccaceae bacterium]